MASTARAAETLTVPEAARVLGIGRTLAYQLTARYLAGEPGGLPAMKLGHCVRVPRKAIDALLNGDVPQSAVAPEPTARELAPAASAEGGAVARRSGRAAKSGRVQLSLLEGR